jgi:putative two-component system response regulator
MLLEGADDYVTKPMTVVRLQAKVKAALRLKDAQDRADLLNSHLLTVNQELEKTLTARQSDLVHARNGLLQALAKLVDHREGENGAHLERMARFSRYLAEEASQSPAFAGQIETSFIDLIACCAPLHDIGKIGLPDHILLKPGELSANERLLMQTHTMIGADTLKEVMRKHGSSLAFLQMAADIARHHHERFDGEGYPDHLHGTQIPLAARLVSICDVYNALRTRRSYKPALSHAAAVQAILKGPTGQFDPNLLYIFERSATHFDRIFREVAD